MNSEYPYHKRLTLQNFTAFSNATLEFVPGINVLVGENGTGKTHVLKALYAWQMARHLAETNIPAKYDSLFAETFGVGEAGELRRTRSKPARIAGQFGDIEWRVEFQQVITSFNGVRLSPPRPVFIPAIEMMAHARNMNGILRDYADFDRTCFDLLAMVTAEPSSIRSNHRNVEAAQIAANVLKDLVHGAVEWSEAEQRFFLSESGKRLPYSLVAEGVRKVTALSRLIELNWLTPGGVLFWDEPEVNINPRWMDEIIQALTLLARSGIQIFLATHSYVILKQTELTLRALRLRGEPNVSVRFFSFRKERGASKVMWTDEFADLRPNPILDQYDQMLAEDWRLSDTEGAR
jgi:predicted ATPase